MMESRCIFKKINCPVAITDETMGSEFSNENALLDWCVNHLKEGDGLTLWVTQKNIIGNNAFLTELSQYSWVEVITSRGSVGMHRANGPVMAFYPSPNELSEFNDIQGMTALGIVAGYHSIRVWSAEIGAERIGNVSPPSAFDAAVNPLLDGAKDILEDAGALLNHNNSITSHFEKTRVKRALETMRDDEILPHPKAAVEWAAAAGWRQNNPKQLGEWVKKYRDGRSIQA